MGWTSISTSADLGIDWPLVLPTTTVDPYLVWADATRFSGLEPAGSSQSLQIAFEISVPPRHQRRLLCCLQRMVRGLSKDLFFRMLPGKSSQFGWAVVPKGLIKWLLHPSVQQFVPRFELGLPQAIANRASFEALFAPRPPGLALPSPVVAVIDDGCPWAHSSFRKLEAKTSKWETRVAQLWLQDLGASGALGGKELSAVLQRHSSPASVDERACYESLADSLGHMGGDYVRQMRSRASHGAHVLDMAAGNPNPLAMPWYPPFRRPLRVRSVDPAATSPIVFVQLPRAAVEDTSGASMNVYVLQALDYIATQTANANTVVNLSYGALAGPHDGSTLLECAMECFLEHEAVRAIVLPAGNGYDSRTHAALHVAPAATGELRVQVMPDDPTDTFVEIWYDAEEAGVPVRATIEVVAPKSQSRSGPVRLGEALQWLPDGGQPSAAIIHAARPPLAARSRKRMILVAVSATRRKDGAGAAPHGEWLLRITNEESSGVPLNLQAWIERDDASFGSARSRSQAYFVSKGGGLAPGHPHASSDPVSRVASLNSFGHGERVAVVGGYRLDAGALAPYSASGPGRQGSYRGPDFCAPCEESRVLPGLLAAGNYSGATIRMNGTSVAAAIATRTIANCLADQHCFDALRPAKDQLSTDAPPSVETGNDHPNLAQPELRRGRGYLRLG